MELSGLSGQRFLRVSKSKLRTNCILLANTETTFTLKLGKGRGCGIQKNLRRGGCGFPWASKVVKRMTRELIACKLF